MPVLRAYHSEDLLSSAPKQLECVLGSRVWDDCADASGSPFVKEHAAAGGQPLDAESLALFSGRGIRFAT